MNYSPKLRKAMEEIKDVLKKHDIAGFIAIHTPGHVEYSHNLMPSYSACNIDNTTGIVVIKGKLEHYLGDKNNRTWIEDVFSKFRNRKKKGEFFVSNANEKTDG